MDRNVEGVVEMRFDVARHYDQPLTADPRPGLPLRQRQARWLLVMVVDFAQRRRTHLTACAPSALERETNGSASAHRSTPASSDLFIYLHYQLELRLRQSTQKALLGRVRLAEFFQC